jgi:hypothetical protein
MATGEASTTGVASDQKTYHGWTQGRQTTVGCNRGRDNRRAPGGRGTKMP